MFHHEDDFGSITIDWPTFRLTGGYVFVLVAVYAALAYGFGHCFIHADGLLKKALALVGLGLVASTLLVIFPRRDPD